MSNAEKKHQRSPDSYGQLANLTAYRTGDEEAYGKLVTGLLGAVARDARRLSHIADQEDLMQEAALAIIEQLRKFDPKKGIMPSSFVLPRARGAMRDYIRTESARAGVSRLIVRQATLFYEVYDALDPAIPEKDRYELASAVVYSKQIVRDARKLIKENQYSKDRASTIAVKKAVEKMRLTLATTHNNHSHISLDDAFTDEGGVQRKSLLEKALTDNHPDSMLEEDLRISIQRAMGSLEERERYVLTLYYGFEGEEVTQEVIAELMGLTESRVSQIRTKAIDKLRKKWSTELRPFHK